MLKRFLILSLALMMALSGLALAEEADAAASNGVVILYTNDVHCAIDTNIGYAGVAAYEKAYEGAGYDVLLVDCGDAVQGAAVGTLSTGEYIVDIMNEVGYDVATIGNHEFDYGMDRFNELVEMAEYPYVSANFTDLEGNTILSPYAVLEAGGYSIAFVGASTPETFSKSTPTYFQDEEGNFIYSFCGGNDGADLYAAVQAAVDDARAEGADYVVVLSHLGTEASSVPFTSTDLIANTSGIDVVLDGHSHSVWEMEIEQNKDGEDVVMSSTGTQLTALGSLMIDAEGNLATQLHTETIFQDDETAAFIDEIEAQYADTLATVVATSDVDLTIYDPTETDADGNPIRLIRSQETNLGDLCADAYRAISGADIAFVNGGGIRDSIPAGDITYEQIIAVHPFGNALCVVEATGQEILDALEMSVRHVPDETGGFLQVSGLTFEVNMGVESSVVVDDADMFVEVAGDRRVQNVLVGGEPIDPEATYTLASHNYMLKSGGDGYTMFADNVLLQDEVMLDNQVLINYITESLGGVVGEEYSDPYGQGRITFVE
mgnify:CR=1 FL=1